MIDSHCHILKEYYPDVNNIIENMCGNKMIVSSTGIDDIKEVISLGNKYSNVYITIGVHPTEVDKIDEAFLVDIEKEISNKKVVAIGEIGLDYHWSTDKENQKRFFIKQLDLASKYNLPVVIHCREAISDVYEILKNYSNLKIVFHCYSDSLEMAKLLLKFNVKFGIGGTVTFKNNVKTKKVVEFLPLENILLETDSPFLTPEPYRGKKNEPRNVYYVALEIARLKNISVEEVLDITTKNTISQFDLD